MPGYRDVVSAARLAATTLSGVLFFEKFNHPLSKSFLSRSHRSVHDSIIFVDAFSIFKDIIWFSNYSGVLDGFPIIGVSFLCQFNILPVHEELQQPSRRRLKVVIHSTIGFCTILYTTVRFLPV